MTTNKDKLFALVKSLTKAEKAHFSKYARLSAVKEKPDYVKLFEFLDKEEKYDEKAVKNHFEGERLLQHFSRKKNQLIGKITESLGVLYEGRTAATGLRRQMNQLPILYEKAVQEKSLLKELDTRVKAMKKQAQKNECLHILIELFDWEKRVIVNQDKKSKEREIQVLLTEQKDLQIALNQELDLRNIYWEAFPILTRDIELEVPKNRARFEQLMEVPLKIKKVKDLTATAKKYYYFLTSSHYRILGEADIAYTHARKLISIFEKEEKTQGYVDTMDYKNQLCFYMITCSHAGKYENYPKIIAKLRALYNTIETDKVLFNTMSFLGLKYYLNTYQFKEAADLSDDIDLHWEGLLTVIPKRRQLAYCYNMSVAYWLSGNTGKAVTWLSQILNFEGVEEGQRIILFARLLQLPIYYDFDDDNLDNRIESTRRVLSKHNALGDFESIVIRFFRKLVRISFDKKQTKEHVQKFHKELTILEKNSTGKPHVLEELLVWCKKISK